jgi:hypothetical protein
LKYLISLKTNNCINIYNQWSAILYCGKRTKKALYLLTYFVIQRLMWRHKPISLLKKQLRSAIVANNLKNMLIFVSITIKRITGKQCGCFESLKILIAKSCNSLILLCHLMNNIRKKFVVWFISYDKLNKSWLQTKKLN